MSDNLALAIRSQEAVVEVLSTKQRFAGVDIIGRRRGIISNDIDAAITGLGACIYVLPGKPVKLNANVPGPYAEIYEIRVRCIENPALNETLPTAHELYEGALIELNQLQLTSLPDWNPLYPAEQNGEEQPDPERVIIDAVFYTSLALPQRAGL